MTTHVVRSVAASAFGLLLAGCVHMAGAQPVADTPSKSTTETRVFATNTCPVTRKSAESFGATVIGALLPPLIDTGIDLIGGALKKAGEDDVTTLTARTSGHFYSSEASKQVLAAGLELGCIVVIRGTFGEGASTDAFSSAYWKANGRLLASDFGVVGDPSFYYEGNVDFSNDLTAFRLVSRVLKYDRTLKDGKRNGQRTIVITFKFQKPANGTEAKSFATSMLTFGELRVGTQLDQLGIASNSSGWMDLPAVTDTATNVLTQSKAQSQSLAENKATKAWLTEKHRAVIGEDMSKLDTTIKAQEANIKALSAALAELERRYAKDRVEAEDLVDEVKAQDQSEAAKAQRRILRVVRDQGRAQQVADARRDLASAQTTHAELLQLRAAQKTVSDLETALGAANLSLANFGPYNLEASISETRKGNEFLRKFGEALLASKADISKALVAELDPAAREQRKKEQQEKEDEDRKALYAARTDALSKALNVLEKRVERDTLPASATALSRQQKDNAVLIAVESARVACSEAARLGAVLPECGEFLE